MFVHNFTMVILKKNLAKLAMMFVVVVLILQDKVAIAV
jgi:hypothetical protein